MSGETQPVAWRVKDYADGWVRYGTEAEAKREAKRTGALIEPLYSAAALASRDAEIERLRGEVAEVYDQGRWIIRMADIREASGVGHKPMLDEVAGAIKAKIAAKDAALGEAERAINRAKEAVEDQDDIELVGSLDAALSTLKTAREG